MTDQRVESAVPNACDLEYLVTLVTDACPPTRKQQSLLGIRGDCRRSSAEESLAEIAAFG
jgi:ureidoacrylate peracid hydrolase